MGSKRLSRKVSQALILLSFLPFLPSLYLYLIPSVSSFYPLSLYYHPSFFLLPSHFPSSCLKYPFYPFSFHSPPSPPTYLPLASLLFITSSPQTPTPTSHFFFLNYPFFTSSFLFPPIPTHLSSTSHPSPHSVSSIHTF